MGEPSASNCTSSNIKNATTTHPTRVYYHLDDSPTPYMSEIPVAPDRLTLGDFKRVFTRKGYRYFCRQWDQQLASEVKAEIVSDAQHLRRSEHNGLFELFLLSPAAGPTTNAASAADTLPRVAKAKGTTTGANRETFPVRRAQHHHSALALSSIASSELTAEPGGGQRVSMATSSGTNTLLSKRAGELLADPYISTSEDPYNRTSISSYAIFRQPGAPMPSAESANDSYGERTLLPPMGRQKRQRKHRKPYVPSTISSASESSYSLPRIEEVKIRLQDAPLGIAVASQDGSIFIYNIQKESAAEKSGQLEVGDQIIQVDDSRFEDLSERQALELLRRLSTTKKTITMYVAKRAPPLNAGEGSDRSDALSQLCETMQLDIGEWVESTKQTDVEPVLPFGFVDPPALKILSEPADGVMLLRHPLMEDHVEKETSDEENAAYVDRRNGLGPVLVPALQKTRQQPNKMLHQHQSGAAEMQTPQRVGDEANGNNGSAVAPCIPQPLHAAMDPVVILRRMVAPRSGLCIRDRKWLKIPVPMSFVGDEMLDWLLANVQGFRDRKGAKAFASSLLTKGLIKHVVNVTSFNEKCYYVFDDSIIAQRLKLEQQEAQNFPQMASNSAELRPPPLRKGKLANGCVQKMASNGNAAQIGPESTTEITYMSSPSSPFFASATQHKPNNNNNHLGGPPQLVIANNPRYASGPNVLNQQQLNSTTNPSNGNPIPLRALNAPNKFAVGLPAWPVSPILAPFNRAPIHQPQQRRPIDKIGDCDSTEATNDYASMIQGEINCGAQFDETSPHFASANNNSVLPSAPTAVLRAAPPIPQRQPKMH